MGDLYRLRREDGEGDGMSPSVDLEEWLMVLETRRNALIMELRSIDRVLLQHGRIRVETIQRRIR